ncbi:hypothetical protein BCV70DRAFT_219578 [Testicularia cyperi]|uniref:IMS import disulfide relay-system CHCH-CHCH-like Cx9C domain-containing protein n=1 Tax=Testicularia cyperi TaxID=1882483 RepID=A0A317XHI0_9BASI|nr:hypothetical protein BCV70DRAFT_219578 [Testicularia cyperi]
MPFLPTKMESSIDQVAAKCGKQLDTFQRCILANQQNPGACETYKTELSRCAANAVPILNEIKNRCAAQVIAYDRCLEQFTSKGDAELEKNCTPRLRDLWFCTEKVKRELDTKDNEDLKKSLDQGKAALSK